MLNNSFKALHTNITSTHFIFDKNTPISLKKSKIISEITFRKSKYKDLSSKYFFLVSNKPAHSIEEQENKKNVQEKTKNRTKHSIPLAFHPDF